MSTKTKKPVERKRFYQCQTCKDAPEQSHPEFVEHLKTVHGYVKAQANRCLVQALDGSDWYSNVFEWTVPTPTGEVKALQVDSGPRHEHDSMRCED